MDLLSELECEFSSLREGSNLGVMEVRVGKETIRLEHPRVGIDFVAGTAENHVFVLPILAVTEVIGSFLPDQSPETLVEFLGARNSPVRVHLRSQDSLRTCWLLNLRGVWARVSSRNGISWIPMGSIHSLEVMAVDN